MRYNLATLYELVLLHAELLRTQPFYTQRAIHVLLVMVILYGLKLTPTSTLSQVLLGMIILDGRTVCDPVDPMVLRMANGTYHCLDMPANNNPPDGGIDIYDYIHFLKVLISALNLTLTLTLIFTLILTLTHTLILTLTHTLTLTFSSPRCSPR